MYFRIQGLEVTLTIKDIEEILLYRKGKMFIF